MTGLREAFESGKAKAVGVCNYDASQMEVMHSLLAKHNIPLACNQVYLTTCVFLLTSGTRHA
jgi:diketogulonate reductase-like aldo/keto reductase